MRIALTGASGFIGQRLMARLSRDGHDVEVIGRQRPGGLASTDWEADAVIHLAGEPVAQRWNDEVKARIRDSRVQGTKALVDAIGSMQRRPRTLICASAIGYYGDRGEEILEEGSSPGTGFLPEVCIEWERQARAAGSLGLRVVMLRIGIVLGLEGGALKQMLPPFRMGIGGPMASGKQWMSWVHVDDLVEMFVFALSRTDVSGPLNATAPNPVRNEEFSKALGAALGRPAVIPTPVFALKLLLGEAASVVLASQHVLPKALQQAGFEFRHPEVREAIATLCRADRS